MISHKYARTSPRRRRGQGLVEYIMIVAAVAMIALVAVSVFGHKVAEQYAIGAGLLPGAHADDNLPITTGEYAGFVANTGGTALVADGTTQWTDIVGAGTVADDLVNNVVVSGSVDGDAFVAP